MKDFEFDWKFKDFEIKTTHGNRGPYIELIKWYTTSNGKRGCFSLAYWTKDSDGYYELNFLGNRPFEEIAEIDISPIWKQLFLAQKMFEDAVEKIEE